MMLTIPVFFSCDNTYIPFLGVTINSLIKNASPHNQYDLYILTSKMDEQNIKDIKKMAQSNVSISFVDVEPLIKDIAEKLNEVRDYYTQAIFYRLFIAKLFPNLKKAIYLDCDIVLLNDIALLYQFDLKGHVLAAATDDVVNNNDDFKIYCENAIGSYKDRYFNSGVLVIDLEKYRQHKILEQFLNLLTVYHFKCVAPDQDYLNYLCRDLVTFFPKSWNRMPVDDGYDGELNLIHYNMFMKPWLYDVKYQEYFWQYAIDTRYYEDLKKMKANYSDEAKASDLQGVERMVKTVYEILASNHHFVACLDKRLWIKKD